MDIKTLMKFGLEESKCEQILEQIKKEILTEVNKKVAEEKAKYEAELNLIKNQNLIEKELTNAGARNLKSVLALIEIPEDNFDELDMEEIKKKIEQLKNDENTSFLFLEKDKELKLKGFTPLETNLRRGKSIKNMDYEELCRYYEEIANI